MTCIVDMPSKKALREHLRQNGDVMIEDPSIMAPFSGYLSVYLANHGEAIVTNHPKRSWFARIRLRKDGSYRVD